MPVYSLCEVLMGDPDAIRRLREGRAAGKTAKLNGRSKKGPLRPLLSDTAKVRTPAKTTWIATGSGFGPEAAPSGPSCPTCGRFWAKGTGTFDKKAYQRAYMKKYRARTKTP